MSGAEKKMLYLKLNFNVDINRKVLNKKLYKVVQQEFLSAKLCFQSKAYFNQPE